MNCFTRLRYVHADGRYELRAKGSPRKAKSGSLIPWYEDSGRPVARNSIGVRTLVDPGVFSKCRRDRARHRLRVGGSLTALRLDVPDAAPVQVACTSSGLAPGE